MDDAQGQPPPANLTLASSCSTRESEPDETLLESERRFYEAYIWCLTPCPKLCDAVVYLNREIDRLGTAEEDWRLAEIMTNVFLLSSALLTAVEDYLHRPTFRLPQRLTRVAPAGRVLSAANGAASLVRRSRLAMARRWREQWPAATDAFLQLFAAAKKPTRDAAVKAAEELKALLRLPLPTELVAERIRIPSGFRKQDLTHFDALALARKFVARFPDRAQPILLVGLRTAGAYFAPLVRAFLKTEGYQTVDAVNVRPPKGLAKWEHAELVRCCTAGYLAVIVDDPPASGQQVALLSEQLRQVGFSREKMLALLPVHHLRPDWRMDVEATPLSDVPILLLDSEEWFKSRLLAREAVEDRLQEYFQTRRFVSASVVASPIADEINARLQGLSRDRMRSRLKRVHAVRLATPSGHVETRFVLAKSVGWGWLGYHAFLAGHRLAGFVPPILGLRDGILYMEWLPQRSDDGMGAEKRAREIATISAYVAARARSLSLGKDPMPGLGLGERHKLDRVFARAFSGNAAARLKRERIRQRLLEQTCPVPTLIDGNMRRLEWIASGSRLLKSDFEHHGMGKDELNVTDPAFDLADAVLQFGFSSEEEQELIRGYVKESGDSGVEARLFLQKLLAGTYAMDMALDGLRQPKLWHVANEFNEQYVAAWNFLTAQTARFCAGRCRLPQEVLWRSPLAVIDIDGVLDRRIFGFPSTTAAGIEALSLLHDHGFAIAVNTARSVAEVREYCSNYGFAGGVAEYGSFLWDAVRDRGRRLVSEESPRRARGAPARAQPNSRRVLE